MQINQILIRPSEGVTIIQYIDNIGKTGSVVVEGSQDPSFQAAISDAQKRLPAEEDRPDKTEIEQEIDELEYRLTQLKQSIGAA